MGRASTDDVVRVIVLTGAGRGFCAGGDMADLKGVAGCGVSQPTGSENNEEVVSFLTGTKTEEQRDPENRLNTRSDFRKRYSYFPAIPKPVIAAINGPAAGLGLIVALYCDLRFASDRASFSTAFSRRGLIAEHGIAWLLPKIVGLSNALDLLFSSRIVDANEASRLGLVNRVFPEQEFYGRRLCLCVRSGYDSFTTSLRIMKKQVWEGQFQSLEKPPPSQTRIWSSVCSRMTLGRGSPIFSRDDPRLFRESSCPGGYPLFGRFNSFGDF